MENEEGVVSKAEFALCLSLLLFCCQASFEFVINVFVYAVFALVCREEIMHRDCDCFVRVVATQRRWVEASALSSESEACFLTCSLEW